MKLEERVANISTVPMPLLFQDHPHSWKETRGNDISKIEII